MTNCSGVVSTTKRWEIWRAEVDLDSKAEVLHKLTMSDYAPDTHERSTLVIPTVTLPYGVYKLFYHARRVKTFIRCHFILSVRGTRGKGINSTFSTKVPLCTTGASNGSVFGEKDFFK